MPKLIIAPREKDLGDFVVSRAIPYKKKRMIGPFIFWDHMGPVELKTGHEMSVRPHPHIGLSTLTYLFSGRALHRDSLGFEQEVRPREVNWMTAGKGIAHSERTLPNENYIGQTIEGIQSWVALPDGQEEVEPSFEHYAESEIPSFSQDGFDIRLVAGEAFGRRSPIRTYSPLFYLEIRATQDAQFEFSPQDAESGVYPVQGQVRLEDHQELPSRHLAVFETNEKIQLSVSQDSQFFIFGGKPFTTERHIWWNFVSSSKERIESAKTDWKERRFDPVAHESEDVFIPLPETP